MKATRTQGKEARNVKDVSFFFQTELLLLQRLPMGGDLEEHARGGQRSVEVEAFLHGGGEQPLPHDVLGGILGQLQVVDAGVHRWVAGVGGVHLQPIRGQRVKRAKEAQTPGSQSESSSPS